MVSPVCGWLVEDLRRLAGRPVEPLTEPTGGAALHAWQDVLASVLG
jgi:hypothetical protein